MQYDEVTLKRLQAVELDMLLEIDRVCKELDIQYFLDSGTALGAARHGGFIPWDDDIDLGMLRCDYERFLERAPVLLPDNYRICTAIDTAGFAPFFAKVIRTDTRFATRETEDAGFSQGIFIDIFPYDDLSADVRIAQEQKCHCGMDQKLSYLYHSSDIVVPHRGFMGKMEKLVCKVAHQIVGVMASPQKLALDFEQWAQKGKTEPSGNLIIMAYPQMKEIPSKVLFPVSTASFEGHELPVPGKLDEYLTYVYGDWQRLPPMEERRNHAPVRLDFGPCHEEECER